MDSLERIKAKQLERGAQMDAAEQLAFETSDSSLESKMQAIGITPGASSAQDILLKLKSKQAGRPALAHETTPRLPPSK
jgi:phage shock protein A